MVLLSILFWGKMWLFEKSDVFSFPFWIAKFFLPRRPKIFHFVFNVQPRCSSKFSRHVFGAVPLKFSAECWGCLLPSSCSSVCLLCGSLSSRGSQHPHPGLPLPICSIFYYWHVISSLFIFLFKLHLYSLLSIFSYLLTFGCTESPWLCTDLSPRWWVGLPLGCGVWAARCSGFSCCGARAPGHEACRGCSTQAQKPWCSAFVALRHVGSSQTGDRALHWTLVQCAIREVPCNLDLIEIELIYNVVLISAVPQSDSVIHIDTFFL